MHCCARCGREVFYAEQKIAINKVWHTFCFSCYFCNKLLDSCSFNSYNGELYCKACYKSFLPCGIRCKPNCRLEPCCCSQCVAMKPNCCQCNKPPRCPPAECPKPKCRPCSPDPCNGCMKPTPRDVNNYYNRNHNDCCKCLKKACLPCPPPRPCCSNPCPPKPCPPKPCCPPPRPSCPPPKPCCAQPKPCPPPRPSCPPPKPCCPPPKPCCPPKPCFLVKPLCPPPQPCCPPDPCCPPKPCPPKPCCPADSCCRPRPCPPEPCPSPRPTPCCCQEDPCCPEAPPCAEDPCAEDPCCVVECCCISKEPPPCPPKQCGEPTCDRCCPPPPKPVCYPPVKCCEPPPPERICYYPPACNPPPKCCCQKPPPPCCCEKKKVKICCVAPLCTRCGEKVYVAEKIKISGGSFHTCCFTCFCCNKQLEVANFYHSQGEIFCRSCYSKLFGMEGYGYGVAATLQSPS